MRKMSKMIAARGRGRTCAARSFPTQNICFGNEEEIISQLKKDILALCSDFLHCFFCLKTRRYLTKQPDAFALIGIFLSAASALSSLQ